MTINEVLDQAAMRLGEVSDYKLAKELGVTQQAISNYRHGKSMPDTYGCFRLAEILEMNPLELVAMIEASKAKSDEKKEYFEDFLARLRNSTQKSGMLGIVFLLSIVAATAPTESKAASFNLALQADCALCQIKKKAMQAIRRFLAQLAQPLKAFS